MNDSRARQRDDERSRRAPRRPFGNHQGLSPGDPSAGLPGAVRESHRGCGDPWEQVETFTEDLNAGTKPAHGQA